MYIRGFLSNAIIRLKVSLNYKYGWEVIGRFFNNNGYNNYAFGQTAKTSN
jgi:hypothetical protein